MIDAAALVDRHWRHMPMPIIRIVATTLACALGGWLPAAAQTASGSPPNIIFIMSDDHAAHAISSYGSRLIQTPHIDRLAKEGMRFENCFVTNSICTPSRAAILTGKYAHLNGVPVFNHIDNCAADAAEVSAAGRVLHRAWSANGILAATIPTGGEPAGFDYWNILPGQGAYFDPVMIEMGQRKKLSGYTTDIITDLAIEFLREAARRTSRSS